MTAPILLYDGECPICLRARDWLLRHCNPDAIELMPCQSPDRVRRAPQVSDKECMEAMQLIFPDGRRYSGASAFAEVLLLTRDRRGLAKFMQLPLIRSLAPFLYRWIARHRFAISAFFIRKTEKTCSQDQGCR